MKNEETSGTRLSELISERMGEKGLSLNDFAKATELTYEHVRRITKGLGAPSKYSLRIICDVLKLSVKECEKLMMVDKVWGKYGSLLSEYLGKNPALDPIDRVWEQLTEEQQAAVISMVQGWARINKARIPL